MLAEVEPDSAIAAARVELATELLDDLRRVDRQVAESKKRLEQVVVASGTTTISIFGVGPVVAATVAGITGDIARFPTRDRFAAFNGTAPVEVSSGGRKVWRLSRRGNRILNHTIHMAAVTQGAMAPQPRSATHGTLMAPSTAKCHALEDSAISDACSHCIGDMQLHPWAEGREVVPARLLLVTGASPLLARSATIGWFEVSLAAGTEGVTCTSAGTDGRGRRRATRGR